MILFWKKLKALQPATTDKKLKRPRRGNTKEDNFIAALQAVSSEYATLKESIKNRTEDQRLTCLPLGSQNQQSVCKAVLWTEVPETSLKQLQESLSGD